MSHISKRDCRLLEQVLADDLVDTHVVSASISVDATGRVTIEELILRQGEFGLTFAVGLRSDDPMRGIALDQYEGEGRWFSAMIGQTWHEVVARDFADYADDMRGRS